MSKTSGDSRDLTCQQPDRDAPKLTCGYPLPCPWHTAVIVPGKGFVAPAGAPTAELKQIADALAPEPKKRSRGKR